MLYSFKCSLGHVSEEIFTVEARPDAIKCPKCRARAKRIITISSVDCSSECPKWIASCTDVVDPNLNPHSREFYKNPTRANLKNWMAGEGLRHRETGEPNKPKAPDTSKAKKETLESLVKSRRIEVR